MASNKHNLVFEKTSFLHGSNSPFIKEMYLKYLNNPKSLPESWTEFFDGLNEDQEIVKKEILGPSWSPKKNKLRNNYSQAHIIERTKLSNKKNITAEKDIEKEKEQSVKAIALIRAYRIRGHLIAKLDPIGMMERKYLHELHPADHGFKKEDYNKKIFLHSYMDRGYSTINEILAFLRKTYCSSIGVEYMHISDQV